MKEIVELMSSFSVLIASIAGLMAINKWKKERYEKVKIESIESLEKSLRNVRNKIVEIQIQNINDSLIKELNEKMALEGSVELYDIEAFIVIKEQELDKVKKELVEAGKRLGEYCDYQGDSMRFSYNYFFTISEQMSSALARLKKALKNSSVNMDQDVVSFITELLIENKERFDLVDFSLIQSPFTILQNEVISTSMKVVSLGFDNENRALRIVVAEKIRLHSLMPKSILISLKIFIMKFRMAGDVILMSDKYAVVVEYSGIVNIYPVDGKTFNEVSSIHKRNSRFTLLRRKPLI